MNKFQPRVPNFVDAGRLDPIEFEKFEDLLQHYFLYEKQQLPGFTRFSKSIDGYLMIEFSDETFYAIGVFENHYEIDLPQWTHPNSKNK